MKTSKLISVILCAALLSGCGLEYQSGLSPAESGSASTTSNSDAKIPSDSKVLCLSENNITEEFVLSDEQWSEYCGIVEKTVSAAPLEIASPYQKGGLKISPESGELPDYFYMTKLCDGYNDFVLVNDTAYPISDEFNAFIEKLSTPEKRLVGSSFKCDEPASDADYLHAAEGAVKAWLETLKKESGRWCVKSFNIIEMPYDAPQITAKSEDGKTFAAVVWFDYPNDLGGFPPESIFARYSDNKFVHKGELQPGIYGLFRYENGECTIIDYVDINEFPNGYKFGLGNADSDHYETFFEFLADEDYTAELLSDYPYKSSAVDTVLSHNVMRLANGEIYFLAIGTMDDDFSVENGDKIGGPMKMEFYTRTDRDGYNSPVYYDQENRQPKWLEFGKDFKLVFDDYSSDGNPDYVIKVGGDENGSVYSLECMEYLGQPAVRKGKIYVYGRFEDSIRFQVVEPGKVAAPVKTENGFEMRIFDITDETGTACEGAIDDYRLYSQRYFMPNAFNSYSAGTDKIIFNAWNNTGEEATFGGDFSIERKSGDAWEEITRGICETVSVSTYNCGELSIDVSGVSAFERAEYRVVMRINGETVYGGFYMGGGEAPTELSISGNEALPDKRVEMKFTVENTGAATARVISAELFKDGTKQQDVDISSLKNLPSGDVAVLSVKSQSKPFSAGEYELRILTDNGEFSAIQTLIPVPEEQRAHLSAVSAEKTTEGVKFTLQNSKYDKSEIKNAEIASLCVLKENKWQETTLFPAEYKTMTALGDFPEIKPFSLKSGECAVFEFVSASEIKALREFLEEFDVEEVGIARGDRLAVGVKIDGEVEVVYFTLD